MSASNAEILREYLVSLGFNVDESSQKKFDTSLGKTDISAKGLAKTLIGVAASAQAMVGVFAVQMERLYYSAKKADSTVTSLQALAFGAQNIGISGDQMRASIEGMARAMRSNPGLEGLLNSLGVEVKGRDKADVMMDLVTQLKSMPFAVAERFASMFGIDPDQLYLMEQGLDQMKEAASLRKKMSADAGLDMDEAAKAAVTYSNALKETTARMGVLYDMVSIRLLPSFMDFTKALNDNLSSLAKWLGQYKTFGDMWDGLVHPKKPTPEQGKPKNFIEFLMRPLNTGAPIPGSEKDHSPNTVSGPPEAGRSGPKRGAPWSSKSVEDKQAFLNSLEKKYALPDGILDRVWKKESDRGSNVGPSKAGARGDFQMMPKTAAELNVDVTSFESSAQGAATMLSRLLKKYGGDLRKAVSAYNLGEGNLDKYILGKRTLPAETKDYADKIVGEGSIQQTNTITITGVANPEETGKAVFAAIDEANSDLVRNNKPRIR